MRGGSLVGSLVLSSTLPDEVSVQTRTVPISRHTSTIAVRVSYHVRRALRRLASVATRSSGGLPSLTDELTV